MQIVQADAYIVVYAVDDEISFKIAKEVINKLHAVPTSKEAMLIFLVGNKTDLVRRRKISTNRRFPIMFKVAIDLICFKT